MRLGGLHGCIDDCCMWKLTLSAALRDPFLNFLEDVGQVEGQMVRRCRHHRGLLPQRLRETYASRMASASSGRTSDLPGEDVTIRDF